MNIEQLLNSQPAHTNSTTPTPIFHHGRSTPNSNRSSPTLVSPRDIVNGSSNNNNHNNNIQPYHQIYNQSNPNTNISPHLTSVILTYHQDQKQQQQQQQPQQSQESFTKYQQRVPFSPLKKPRTLEEGGVSPIHLSANHNLIYSNESPRSPIPSTSNTPPILIIQNLQQPSSNNSTPRSNNITPRTTNSLNIPPLQLTSASPNSPSSDQGPLSPNVTSPRYNNGRTSPGSSEKEKKRRTRLKKDQASVLKAFFEKDNYPNKDEKEKLANQLSMTYGAVTTWFSNKRQENRRKDGSRKEDTSSPQSNSQKSGIQQTPQQPSIIHNGIYATEDEYQIEEDEYNEEEELNQYQKLASPALSYTQHPQLKISNNNVTKTNLTPIISGLGIGKGPIDPIQLGSSPRNLDLVNSLSILSQVAKGDIHSLSSSPLTSSPTSSPRRPSPLASSSVSANNIYHQMEQHRHSPNEMNRKDNAVLIYKRKTLEPEEE